MKRCYRHSPNMLLHTFHLHVSTESIFRQMNSNKTIANIAGWLVFAVAMSVYYLSAERSGSLWDCGEFILGAYKLQVVHPPGAPLFLLVGRLFTWFAELLSNNPSDIAFAVNLMSGICTALAATLVCWITIMLGKLALVGSDHEMNTAQAIAAAGAGVSAGLAAAFSTSIWFSAVEGEVYAMSTFFTALTLWAMIKWYSLPDTPQADRWIPFSVYSAGLSIGVHLLSILTFPALAMFYYFKKYKNHTLLGMAAAAGVGVVIIGAIQRLIIVGIPGLWGRFELLMVNTFGLPFHSGLIPTLLLVGAVLVFGLRYAHQKQNAILQMILVGAALVTIGFSTIGIVVIRANVDTPINMNAPSDAMRLIPYLNREQYGERPLLRGPHFEAQPLRSKSEDRYGRVGNRYEIVESKISYEYAPKDQMLFPRMGDYSQSRPQLYKQWMGLDPEKPLPIGRPNQADNISFLMRYQLGWMYWRYFMWNFAGRQNGDQGYYPWDKSSGHWLSGIKPIDSWRLYNQSELPDRIVQDKARNKYYMLPFLFGVLGLLFHFQRRRNDALGLLAMFIITGIGIIIYSNQPPNEPRERDYVLAGSFFTYCIWIGMGVLAIFEMLRERLKMNGLAPAVIATAVVLVAPILMGTQNFDDHTRRYHSAARDYASNFLQSCAPNAVIFTYGDNDTYPLWYAQEVEGIRTDVRVVNLSLIAVDWYIDLLRRKINDSPELKMTLSSEAIRGRKRNQIPYYNPSGQDQEISIQTFLQFIGEDHPLRAASGNDFSSHYYSKKVFLPIDREQLLAKGIIKEEDLERVPDRIPLNISRDYLIKDDLAVLDIIASNLWERPIYFAVTCRSEKFFGLQDFMSLEGLALRITPVQSQSDPIYGIIGSGRPDSETIYKNVMEKFRWGGFDTYNTHVDRSYTPSVQSTQLSIRRAAIDLLQKGQQDKALQLIDKYFQSFPHMNFPYDYRTMYMLDVYFQANAYDRAKPHVQILANEIAQHMQFYESLDPNIVTTSFQSEYGLMYRTMEDLVRQIRNSGDAEFLKQLEGMFAPYREAETLPENVQQPIE